jgi:cytochrome c oxidase subunit IV
MAGFQMDHYHVHTYVPGQEIEKPKTKWIWKVFWILLVVTTVEVGFAFLNDLGGGEKRLLPAVGEKWFFITLTLVKAYYIVFSFMHLGDEKFNFKLTVSLTSIFLIYFIALLMFEGYALRDNQLIRPDFFKRVYHVGHATDGHHDHGGGQHGAGDSHH